MTTILTHEAVRRAVRDAGRALGLPEPVTGRVLLLAVPWGAVSGDDCITYVSGTPEAIAPNTVTTHTRSRSSADRGTAGGDVGAAWHGDAHDRDHHP
ncbi:hypothetical protein ACH4TS_31915 [Streptomyces albidoflavus]